MKHRSSSSPFIISSVNEAQLYKYMKKIELTSSEMHLGNLEFNSFIDAAVVCPDGSQLPLTNTSLTCII